jgi:3D (Asp-Asp-Asp) domain-containing protein
MTRINLLVAKVVLLGICILGISSVSVWAEEIKVSVTAYTLKECYHNKGKTASGEQVRRGIVAVSPDLERKGLKLGTKIIIGDMGTFTVKDRTSRKNRGNIDIYMPSYTKALRFGRQKYTLVENQEGLNLFNGKKKYICFPDSAM